MAMNEAEGAIHKGLAAATAVGGAGITYATYQDWLDTVSATVACVAGILATVWWGLRIYKEIRSIGRDDTAELKSPPPKL